MKIDDLQLIKRIIEGALMAAERPLPLRGIKELFDELEQPDDALIEQAVNELQEDTAERGFELVKVASGYRYQVKQELSRWVGKLWKERAPRYSRALLETLSLIAYRQPITRGEIEDIRGVAVSTQIIKTLLEREWVKVVGHKDVPGRPAIYATTKQFLDYFNLTSLDQLPPLAEIRDLNTISREFNVEMPPELQAELGMQEDTTVAANDDTGAQEEGESAESVVNDQDGDTQADTRYAEVADFDEALMSDASTDGQQAPLESPVMVENGEPVESAEVSMEAGDAEQGDHLLSEDSITAESEIAVLESWFGSEGEEEPVAELDEEPQLSSSEDPDSNEESDSRHLMEAAGENNTPYNC